jgi:hypothetical protein
MAIEISAYLGGDDACAPTRGTERGTERLQKKFAVFCNNDEQTRVQSPYDRVTGTAIVMIHQHEHMTPLRPLVADDSDTT